MKVEDHERISRFLFTKRHYSTQKNLVKPEAFVPHPHIELSVSCTHDLNEEDVWALGTTAMLARSDNRNLHGRGDLLAGHVYAQKLTLDRDDDPPKHANILGWPEEGGDAQLMKATELASQATLLLIS